MAIMLQTRTTTNPRGPAHGGRPRHTNNRASARGTERRTQSEYGESDQSQRDERKRRTLRASDIIRRFDAAKPV